MSTAPDPARYARHLALPEIGAAGQQKLADSAVLVIGAGGLGSPASLYLAAAGVGRIGILDHDRVEVSNLQRQVLFATGQIGQGKAATARERLAALNPSIDVIAHAEKLVAGNVERLFAPYDVILDGTDRLATRYLINDACVLLGKPLVSAAIHRFEGQAMTYLPGRSACYRCLYPESPEDLIPNCATAGVLGVLPGVMGSLQATEAIKLLVGIGEPLAGRLLAYDALGLTFDEFRFSRRPECAVCGEHPTITSVAHHEEKPLNRIFEWTPVQLADELKRDEEKLLLVDVREPWEWEQGRLPGSVHIPLGSLPQRMDEIPADVTPVFICAVGGRSMAACRLFASRLERDAINLAGGVQGWSGTFGAPPAPGHDHDH